MKTRKFAAILLVVVLLLSVAVSMGQAQGPGSDSSGPENPALAESALDDGIPIQGRLTDSHGNPLNGNYSIRFSLYKSFTGGTAVCSDTDTVHVSNGLFTAKMDFCSASDISGDQLYLGIKVGSDPEMTPRQPIYAVPYARSLRPGAMINSQSGTALYLAGTGVLKSSAKSYIWISGNNLRKKRSSDSTQFELDRYGGVKVTPGGSGRRDVMLPVTLPGKLYGQNVTLTGIDVYFKSQGDFDGIGGTFVRRQTGAGSGDTIIANYTDRVCTTACSYHLNLTANNVLSDEHGVVYVAFQLFFSGSSTYVQIGGVRLTLKHN